jgi:hypothetical protein
MSWKLWLDDQVHDEDTPNRHAPLGFHGADSSIQAKGLVRLYGPPEFMDLDHDLGGEDTAMSFLRWLAEEYPDSCPRYRIHSENVAGQKNIVSFMDSWRRTLED